MKKVKVGMLPGRLVEVVVEDNATVAQAFSSAGISIESGYEIRSNGATVSASDGVTDNGLIVLVKKIKGNNITGYVHLFIENRKDGIRQEYFANDGDSLETILNDGNFDYNLDEKDIKVIHADDGEEVTIEDIDDLENTYVGEGDIIILNYDYRTEMINNTQENEAKLEINTNNDARNYREMITEGEIKENTKELLEEGLQITFIVPKSTRIIHVEVK